MAVVSISRIQIRRGTVGQGSSLPQLASGELGWAIDTQELYIGNGSTSEGAPAVGNTRILTEKTNIFKLAEQYTYRSDSNLQTSETVPVTRSIAERLDDRVSIKSFSGIDQTQQLQKALYELYLRDPSSTTAPVLHVEPGTFTITRTIYVPPFTTIIGAGKNKTILKKTGAFDMFRTISSETTYPGQIDNTTEVFEPGSTLKQARGIRFENMTLEAEDYTVGATSFLLQLESCRDSEFTNIRFVCNTPNVPGINPRKLSALGFVSKNDIVCSSNNNFVNCEFVGLKEAAFSSDTVKNNKFLQCAFNDLERGVVLGEGLDPAKFQDGAQDNTVVGGRFDNIYQEALLVPVGTNNESRDNWYGNVGNNIGGPAAYPVVSFGEIGNFSVDDTFERKYSLDVAVDSVTYFPTVAGPTTYTNHKTQRASANQGTSPVLRLEANVAKFYSVAYFYKSETNNYKRVGELTITVDPVNNIADLVDEYEFTGEDGAAGASIRFTSALHASVDNTWVVEVSSTGISGQPIGGSIVFNVTSKS